MPSTRMIDIPKTRVEPVEDSWAVREEPEPVIRAPHVYALDWM